jgi:hypothetical protein
MSKIVAINTFYAQITSILDWLIDMFPDDADFATSKTFVSIAKKTNPSLVINTFHEAVTVPYEDKINARDEAFLLEYKGAEYGNDAADIIVKMKGYWQDLDTQTKDSLWQYLYILKELTKRAYTEAA